MIPIADTEHYVVMGRFSDGSGDPVLFCSTDDHEAAARTRDLLERSNTSYDISIETVQHWHGSDL